MKEELFSHSYDERQELLWPKRGAKLLQNSDVLWPNWKEHSEPDEEDH